MEHPIYHLQNDAATDDLVISWATGQGGSLSVAPGVSGHRVLEILRQLTQDLIEELGDEAPAPPEPEPEPTPEPEPEPEPEPPAPEPEPAPPPQLFTPSADTRVVYVSSSEGNDSNDGLSMNKPKRTIPAGIALLRNGYPDWLLLKRGDTFDAGLGDWKKFGRSAAERMVVWTYGPSPDRPVLQTGSVPGLKTYGGGGTPAFLHSLAFSGLHFYAHTRDPEHPAFAGPNGANGVYWLRHSSDVLFDDCMFQGYVTGIVAQNYDGSGVTNVTIRRCVVVDCYGIKDKYHGQGAYISGVTGLVIEDCVFDRNGSRDGVEGAGPTLFNHNLYLQNDNDLNVVVRNNIICRASSHGIQLRSGGVIENNLFHRNPINVFCGYDTPVPGATAAVLRNVVLEGTDIDPSNPRGFGITLKNLVSARVEQNVVAHQRASKVNRRSIEVVGFATYANNVIYDWSVGSTGRGWGETLEVPGPWADPNRTVGTYCQSLGISPDEFYLRIRAQSRGRFDPRFTAEAINAYVRDGFKPG